MLLSDEEHETLQGLANGAGVSTSEYVRRWIRHQGLAARIEMAWSEFRSAHDEGLALASAAKKIPAAKLLERMQELFNLAHEDYRRGREVYGKWQTYRNALQSSLASAQTLQEAFRPLASAVDRWLTAVRAGDERLS